MDRAQEIRSLMKQSGKVAGNASTALSGKDKARLLKLKKEQQKQKVVPAGNTSARQAVAPSTTQEVSGLPSGFFDDEPAPIPPQVGASTNATNGPARADISNLPQGFFDNPVEDLNARGIAMEQFSAKVEEEEKAELDAFLSQVKGLEGDQEIAEEQLQQEEGAVQQFEEEAAQMAHQAQLLALRVQSQQVASRAGREAHTTSSNNADDDLDAKGQEALENLLKEAEALRKATQLETSAAQDVEGILYQKLAQEMANKRKRSAILSSINSVGASARKGSKDAESSDSDSSGEGEDSGGSSDGSDGESESSSSGSGSGSDDEQQSAQQAAKRAKYTPLNFMDWTARTI